MILLLALALAGCAAEATQVAPDHSGEKRAADLQSPGRFLLVDLPHSLGAIVPESYARSTWPDLQVEGLAIDGFWTPGPEEVLRAHSRIRATLVSAMTAPGSFRREHQLDDESFGAGEFDKIVEHFDEFRSQYMGVIVEGRRQLLCNFFPAADGGLAYWTNRTDGGFWYWRVLYDPDSDRCTDFAQGGYA